MQPSTSIQGWPQGLTAYIGRRSRGLLSPEIKRWPKLVMQAARRPVASRHALPDFCVIGAQKAGTTSLFNSLSSHPCILAGISKEAHFFDNQYHKGIGHYRANFPATRRLDAKSRLRGRRVVTGEATPYYLFHPHVPRRCRQHLPQLKIVVMLRNPVERAFSHYRHEVRKGREPLSFEEAIAREPQRLAGELETMLRDEHYYSYALHRHSYLARGIYVDQIERWQAYYPPEQLLILHSETFFSDPAPQYRRVLEFLGLPDSQPNGFPRLNKGQKADLTAATRRQLVDYFAPHNQRLYSHLGVQFDWDD